MSLDDVKHRIFGRSARGTLLRLGIASIAVGAILSVLQIDPREFWTGVFEGVQTVISLIGDTAGEVIFNILSYLVLGAAIVLPIWLLARLLTGGGGRSRPRE